MPATAMPFGLLSQVCHTACSSFAFIRAATVSFTPLRSLLPSLRCITPRSQLSFASWPGSPLAIHKSSHRAAPAIRKPTLQYSLGFIPLHFVIHSLQYRSVHPLPIIWLAGRPLRLRSPCGC